MKKGEHVSIDNIVYAYLFKIEDVRWTIYVAAYAEINNGYSCKICDDSTYIDSEQNLEVEKIFYEYGSLHFTFTNLVIIIYYLLFCLVFKIVPRARLVKRKWF